MRWIRFFAAVLLSVHAARAEERSVADRLKGLVPGITVPPLPDIPSLSLLSISDVSISDWLNTFIQQLGDTLPILEEMGYKVCTFKVQWSLPPTAALRLLSTSMADPRTLQPIIAKASGGGILMKSVVFSAAEAKRIQSHMKLGTAIIDVDIALKPKVRMHFSNSKSAIKAAFAGDELVDLVCGQASNGVLDLTP
jgi:hypothetical protein